MPRRLAVAPISALGLLQQERERKQHRRPACCLLHHPGLTLPLGITQLAGPAGTGKTQIALTLLCDCILQSKQQRAVYVSLGGSSSHLGRTSKRLATMLASRLETNHTTKDDDGDGDDSNNNNNNNDNTTDVFLSKEYLSRIHVHWIRNSEDLLELLETKLEGLLQLHHPNVSVVVLDGIANLFRGIQEEEENTPNPWQHRATMFFRISSRCKQLSSSYQTPFLIINEATTKIANTNENLPPTHKNQLQPALGLSWAQSVNSTFFVTRGGAGTDRKSAPSDSDESQPNQTVSRRLLKCIKAPHLPGNEIVSFFIDHRGTFRIK